MKVAIGQDSHRFEDGISARPLVLGGVVIPNQPALLANSDGDVMLHALTNAISGITGVNILGGAADELCRQGITDSAAYLKKAMEHLELSIAHISFSVECARPKLSPHIEDIRKNVAMLTGLSTKDVGLTATSGEGLTAFGRGEGIAVFCCVTAI